MQQAWSPRSTGAMDERGRLVRDEVAHWLRDKGRVLAGAMGIPIEDFLPEGRGGTGLNARVPWTPFWFALTIAECDSRRLLRRLSVSFDGHAVYLSLN
jgi:hypothetical protein